jgi:hypothetical protein
VTIERSRWSCPRNARRSGNDIQVASYDAEACTG